MCPWRAAVFSNWLRLLRQFQELFGASDATLSLPNRSICVCVPDVDRTSRGYHIPKTLRDAEKSSLTEW